VPVHHVDVEQVGFGGDAFDVVGELGEISGQDRRSDLGAGHGITLRRLRTA
jgi:hypothetical protein